MAVPDESWVNTKHLMGSSKIFASTGSGPSMLMVVVVEFSEMQRQSVSGW